MVKDQTDQSPENTWVFLAKLIRPSLKLRSYINSELKEHKATH